jgi:carboxyl-terminal processing protease
VGIVEKLIGGLFGPDTKIGTAQTRTTRDELVAKGTGSHAFTGRVFVLVDASSASCSELFARIMQLDDRGTVVGDTSMGAVMGARSWVRQVYGRPSYYAVEITVSDLTMSDGQRLENIGVTPDFVVLPSAEDLRAGRDPALAKALAFAHTPLYEATAPALTAK